MSPCVQVSVAVRSAFRCLVTFLIFLGAGEGLSASAATGFEHCAANVTKQQDVLRASFSKANQESIQGTLRCIAGTIASGENPLQEIHLFLPDGKIYFSEPIELPKVFLEKKVSVRIQPAHSGKTIFSGAMPLPSWTKVKNSSLVSPLLPRSVGLYKVAISNDLAKKIRIGVDREHGQNIKVAAPELIVGGRVLSISRWPETGFARVEEVLRSAPDFVDIRYSGDLPALKEQLLLAQGFWFYDWADAQRQAQVLDERRSIIRLRGAAIRYGVRSGARFVLKNSPAFIYEDGQYSISPEGDEIYFSSADDPVDVEITSAVSLFYGRASRLKLSGVVLDGARGNAIDIQGDDNEFSNVTVRNVGVSGIRLVGYRNFVTASRVESVGGIGVELIGGDRQTLRSSNSKLESSTIEHFGRTIWSANPGVRAFGVGVSILGNVVRFGPHAGIFYFGNDHLIQKNEVYEVAKLTDDVGAIYSGQDWTARGSRVVGNYVHDIHGVGREGATAFYLDDQASGIAVEDNVAWRVDRGVLIGGGRDNIVARNIFIGATQCGKVDERGVTTQTGASRIGKQLLERLHFVPYSEDPYMRRYPKLMAVLSDQPGLPIGNSIKNNVGKCDWRIAKSAYTGGDINIDQHFPAPILQVSESSAFDKPPRLDSLRYRLRVILDYLGNSQL